ncbi:hypothetical protein [Microcoleus sp. BROC3]|uniref:hypothetical protein n=1 Tax=Microcoleus sp. BROC3 TaxID=3055323 RepID=UPI002FD0956E
MPLNNPVTDPQIPQPIARDSEIAAALIKTLSLLPRTGGGSNADANTAIQGVSAGFKWIDGGAAVFSNFPATTGVSGCLIQIDGLWGTTSAGLYCIQFHSTLTVLSFRAQNNGTWGAWRTLG